MPEHDPAPETVLIEAARGRWAELVRAAEDGQVTRLRDRDSGAEASLVPLSRAGEPTAVGWPVWSVTDARPKLGDLVRGAADGQPVVLARRGRPVAELVGQAALGSTTTISAPAKSVPTQAPSRPTAAQAVAAPLGDLLDSLTAPAGSAASEVLVPTGLPGLDDLTAGGLRPGRLVVLTAPPGAGATTFALGMARAAVLADPARPVLVASGQLTRSDIMLRVLAAEADTDLHNLTAGTLSDADRQRVGEVAARLRTAPLHLADHLLTLEQVRTAAQAIDGLALVVLDPVSHFDLAAPVPPPVALRRLAREVNTAVLTVATTGTPGLDDLVVEADLALRLDRDALAVDLAALTVTHHRHGPTDTLRLVPDLARARLLPYSRETELAVLYRGVDPTAEATEDASGPQPPVELSESAPVAPATNTRAPGPENAPQAAEALVARVTDRDAAGQPVVGLPAPCVLCGQPTPYRAAGMPQHWDGVCTPGATLTAATSVGNDDQELAATPAAAAGGQPGPGRPVKERQDTSGLIARNVAAVLEDNGGDMDAALAALIKRAIPDGMALLNSTRVGSTYDFTNYVDTDAIPILKKPSRDGADLIWEGRPKWRNRIVESGPARTVTALDVNGAYLSALKTHLPIGAPRHSTDGAYDRKRSGVYLIDPPAWAHEDLPNPLGNREEPGPLWVTDPTLRLLIRLAGPKYGLCSPPRILESWTSGSSEALLERFRREMAAARDAAIEEGDRVTLEYVKAMYAKFVSTIGESSANREMRRPDWMHIIRSQAFANLWLKAWKAHQAGLTVVRMLGTDELHVIGDWRAVFTEGRKLTDMKLKTEYSIGSGGDS
ncbi:type II toxin-antitoxin system prevent-host-death family antitoxin [Streptomyces sp. 8K308]|uniref:type II toxin-antitoxin system prevent-host-death family antitoxin n=1 Tax=Streptomyces sp. 8K308 TaxID=2530388 RepID=UPI0014052DD7|nr:type II toxin-antitoxin system prevent-host-death family antitoxin [Streptomyces sp. 8K308]